jgi:activator of HSP90 ATPase
MSKTIRQRITFKATPHEVYEALMDSRKHAQFSGASAEINRQVGEAFNAYDGYISGLNLELVPDAKIVQNWHASDWPDGFMSRVTFKLTPVNHGTRLDFTHSGVPDEEYESLKQGWIDNYWKPMRQMLDIEKP